MLGAPSLDDIARFQEVLERGSFSAAARALGIPKSTLSKSVARLEETMGVHLLERTTRRLRATEIGRTVAQHSREMVAAYEAARLAAAEAMGEPAGRIRVSCPPGLLDNLVDRAVLGFLEAFPRIDLELQVIARPVDLIEDNIDVALRARARMQAGASFVVRRLGLSRGILVAAPDLLAGTARLTALADLRTMPALTMSGDEDGWKMVDGNGTNHLVTPSPRLVTSDIETLQKAAIRGVGVAQLPEHLCAAAIADGRLVRLLPDLTTVAGTVYAVFSRETARAPALRAFLDHLVSEFRELLPAGG